MIAFSVNSQEKKTGVSFYNSERFLQAQIALEKELKADSSNISTLYNLGLTHQALHQFGTSIYYFEMVLSKVPNHQNSKDQIIRSLALSNSQLDWTPRINTFKSILFSVPSNVWFALTFIFVSLLSLFLTLRFSNKNIRLIPIFNLLLISSSSLFIICFAINYQQYSYFNNESIGVVKTDKNVFLDESGNKVEIQIPEGKRINIIATEGDFISFEDKNKQLIKVNRNQIGIVK